MRIIVVNDKGVEYHSGMLQEEILGGGSGCSCNKKTSVRDLVLKNNDVFVSIPNNEYVAIIVRKHSNGVSDNFYQRNLDGVSIFSTGRFNVMLRFMMSYQSALVWIQQKLTNDPQEQCYIVSVKTIVKIEDTVPANAHNIFKFETSFGDVFSRENYGGGGEQTSLSMMYDNLQKGSYRTLDDTYDTCWL